MQEEQSQNTSGANQNTVNEGVVAPLSNATVGDMTSTQIEKRRDKIWTRDFVLISLINLTTFIGFNMTNTGMPVYVSSLGASDVIVGLVTTISTLAALAVRPFAGLMLDRFGRKGILVVTIAAMCLVIVAYGVFPVIGFLLSLRLCHGIAWGLGSTAASTIAADAIPKRRFAEGMGYFALTTALAVAIAPALALGLLESVGIVPMLAVAAISTAVSFVLALLQHSKRPEKQERTGRITLFDLFDKRAILPSSIMFLLNIAFASLMTFIALHGKEQGVENIFLYFTVYAVVTLVTRPLIGKAIDNIGYFLPGILSTIGVIITLVIVSFSTNIIMFCIAGVFGGLGIGTAMGTFQAMAVAAVPSSRRGVATSTYFFGFDGGIALGALVAGALSAAAGYSFMYLVVTVFPLAACLIIIIAGKKRLARYSVSAD